MEKCTAKKKKDNFGLPSIKDKAQNTSLLINTVTLTINLMIKHKETISLLMNVQEQEMDQSKQYFGKFSS